MGFDETLQLREEFMLVGFAGHAFHLLLHICLDRLARSAGPAPDDLVGILGDVPDLDGGRGPTQALQRYFACKRHVCRGKTDGERRTPQATAVAGSGAAV